MAITGCFGTVRDEPLLDIGFSPDLKRIDVEVDEDGIPHYVGVFWHSPRDGIVIRLSEEVLTGEKGGA